jgi:hypothetical protein
MRSKAITRYGEAIPGVRATASFVEVDEAKFAAQAV